MFIIPEATMHAKLDTSEKNIELAIKSWLRHAKERLTKRNTPQEEETINYNYLICLLNENI